MLAAARVSIEPKISFGIIALNGEPFTRYQLRALYPFAHQIIVVEGAAPAACGIATAMGHSRDGTLESVNEFKALEDAENKVVLVTAEIEGHPDGFWPGEKDEQSQAYAKRATGDYLWQVDIDEFYQPADMQRIMVMLRDDPAITAISFKQLTFWGGFNYIADGWYLRRYLEHWHRLFKWGPAYQYVTHRPPTVLDDSGRDLRQIHWLDGRLMARQGILIQHYSLVFPRQVEDKTNYYAHAPWAQSEKAEAWAEQVYFKLRQPYRVHNVYDYPSWLERFEGIHPPQIQMLRTDIRSGAITIAQRPTQDIEKLLRSRGYRAGRAVLRWLTPVAGMLTFWLLWRARWQSFLKDPRRALHRMSKRLRRMPLTEARGR